jgi:hypothetical protein
MTDDLRDRYRDALRARGGANGPQQVPLERLEALAAGRLGEDDAMALLDRVMADETLRREFELLRAVHEAAAPSAPARRWLGPLALAATMVIAIGGPLLLTSRGDGDAPRLRGGDTSGIALVAPAADEAVTAPVTLAWRPVEGAMRYGLEVLDEDGAVAFSQELRDTVLVLPQGAVDAGARYRWLVTARVPGGTVRSRPRAFVVGERRQ